MFNAIKWLADPFALTCSFLFLVFATGGSSWPHEWQLIALRPIAVLLAAWGLAAMHPEHWRNYWIVWSLFAAATLLTILHLLPLPYSWWSNLPGREIVSTIDQLAGLGKIARPISMHPDATVNALLSMAVPLAVLSLGVRLSEVEHRRLAGLLSILIATSALIGILQLSGQPISLYEPSSSFTPSGLFNNRNHQGALLAMAIPLAVLAWRGGFKSWLPAKLECIAMTSIAAFMLPLTLVTGSRLGLLLTVFAMFLALFELPWMMSSRRVTIALVAKVVAIGVAFSLLIGVTLLAGRNVALDRLSGASNDLRYPLWQSIVEALPSYWPWGTGIGSYADAYQIQEPDALLRPTFSNHAHNEWLEIALTAGLPGLVILATATVFGLLGIARAWRTDRSQAALARTGSVILLILALASTSDYPVRTPIMMAILALAAIWMSPGLGRSDPPKLAA